MFLLDTLDSMPRMRVSDSLMGIFLWVLKESGAPDVPSLGQLREVQATLRDSSGVPSESHKSARGNVFYMNDIRSIVSKVCHSPYPHLPLHSQHYTRITPTPTPDHGFRFTPRSLTVRSARSGTQRSGEKKLTPSFSLLCMWTGIAISMC